MAETPTSTTPAAIANMDSGFLDVTRSPFSTPLQTHHQYSQEQTHAFPHRHNFPLPDNSVASRHSPINDRSLLQPNADVTRSSSNFHSAFHPNFPVHVGAAANIVQNIPRIQLVPNEEAGIYKNLNAIVLNRDLLDTMGRRTDATADAYMKVPDTLRQVFDFKNTIVSTDPNNPLVEQNRAARKKRFRRTKQQMMEDAMKAKEKDGNIFTGSSSASPKRGRKRTKSSFSIQRPQDRLKRPRNGYMIFMNEVYEETKLKNPNLKFGEISAAIGERWKNMSKEEQMPYHHKHEQEKIQYENAKQAMSKGTICFVEENISPPPSEYQKGAREASNKSPDNGSSSTSFTIPSQLLTPKSPVAKLPTPKLTSTTSESVSSSRDTIMGGRTKLPRHASTIQSPPASENIIKISATERGSPATPLLVTPLTAFTSETDEIQSSAPINEIPSKPATNKSIENSIPFSHSTSRSSGSNGSDINGSDHCDDENHMKRGDNSSQKSSSKSNEKLHLIEDARDIESPSTNDASELEIKSQKGRGRGVDDFGGEEEEKLAEKELVDDDDEVESINSERKNARSRRQTISVDRVTRSSLLKGKFALRNNPSRESTTRRGSLRIAKLLSTKERASAKVHNRSLSNSCESAKSSSIVQRSDDNSEEDEVDSDSVDDEDDSDSNSDTRNKWHFPIVGTKTSPGLTPYRKRKVSSIDGTDESKATGNPSRTGSRGGRRGRRTTRNAGDVED
ncbi:14026_t:CDS:2, partial [Acaulospora colombiana]